MGRSSSKVAAAHTERNAANIPAACDWDHPSARSIVHLYSRIAGIYGPHWYFSLARGTGFGQAVQTPCERSAEVAKTIAHPVIDIGII
jgi:hypothetical protein